MNKSTALLFSTMTRAQSCFTIPELRRLELLDGVFDGIFLSSDFGSKKPAPAFFHAALAKTGLSGSEVLMVGNDQIADIRGADSVGMKSRYIHSWQSPPRGFSLPESCREIMSLEELLEGRGHMNSLTEDEKKMIIDFLDTSSLIL